MMRLLLVVLISMLAVFPAQAENAKHHYADIEHFPILHEGRVKPFKSFAEIMKTHYAGEKTHATQWLLETLFNPADAIKEPLFLIRNPTIKGQFELKTDQTVFSYEELQTGLTTTQSHILKILNKNKDTHTADEKALLDIHDKALGYMALLQSFSAVLPIQTDSGQKTFFDLKAEGQNVETFITAGETSRIFKVLPSTWNTGEWLSPWQMILSGQGSPASQELLKKWGTLALAYRQKDDKLWSENLERIEHLTREQAGETYSATRLHAENLYKGIKPYLLILALYAFALGMLKAPRTAIALTCIAVFAHASSIALRIYILDRPPVGTLYESVLFVSMICAALGAWISHKKQNSAALVAGNISAIALLAIAPVLAKGGDSLEVLAAVLNTNFWLATHVLIITIGYGICIVAGTMAHGELAMKAFKYKEEHLAALQKSIYQISIAALLFTTVGTILGGIWADQSWGRFWGWDPKENGALLIVLWLIWIQHGRLSGHIKPLGFLALIAALNIVVALAWFGVNLLSVGLHSYGFISGIAEGLFIFCAIEIVLIIALLFKARTHKTKEQSA